MIESWKQQRYSHVNCSDSAKTAIGAEELHWYYVKLYTHMYLKAAKD